MVTLRRPKKKKRVDLAFNLGLVQLMTSGRALSKRSSADFPIVPHHAEMGWKLASKKEAVGSMFDLIFPAIK